MLVTKVNQSMIEGGGVFVINVRDYGAVGDGVTLDDTAIDAAIVASRTLGVPLYFPAGKYRISTTKTFYGNYLNVRGENGLSRIYSTEDIPFFTLNLNSDNMYHSTFSDLMFEGDGSAAQVGILLIGSDNTKWCSHNKFLRLTFISLGDAIANHISAMNAGLDTQFVWNDIGNIQTNNVVRGIYHQYGSGTGNIIHDCNIVASAIGIGYNGASSANIGDILISGIHFGGSATYGVLLPNAGSYKSNISINGCQFDAGVVNSIVAVGYSNLELKSNNYGGASPPSISNSIFVNHDQHPVGVTTASGRNASTPFRVTLGDGGGLDFGYGGVMVEVVSEGQVAGRGAVVATTRFHIFRSGPSAAGAAQIDTATLGTGGATCGHSLTQSGMTFTVNAVTNPTVGGTYLFSTIRVVGHNASVIVV